MHLEFLYIRKICLEFFHHVIPLAIERGENTPLGVWDHGSQRCLKLKVSMMSQYYLETLCELYILLDVYLSFFNIKNHLKLCISKNSNNDKKKKKNSLSSSKMGTRCLACVYPYLLAPPSGYRGPYLRSKGLNYFLKLTCVTSMQICYQRKRVSPKIRWIEQSKWQ